MRDTIIKNMKERFDAWYDLANSINANLVDQELPVEKSKSLKVHFWCVVGARESYTKALEEGAWAGFSCSLDDYSPKGIAAKLQASARAFCPSSYKMEQLSVLINRGSGSFFG